MKRTLSIEIEESRWEQLTELCRRDGTSPRAIMKEAVDGYIDKGGNAIPAPPAPRSEPASKVADRR